MALKHLLHQPDAFVGKNIWKPNDSRRPHPLDEQELAEILVNRYQNPLLFCCPLKQCAIAGVRSEAGCL